VDVAAVGATASAMLSPLIVGSTDHDVLFGVVWFGGVIASRMVPLKPPMNAESLMVKTRLLPTTVGGLVISPADPLVAEYNQLASVIDGVVPVSSGIVMVVFGPHSLSPSPSQEIAML
jgi:hypothetical protein